MLVFLSQAFCIFISQKNYGIEDAQISPVSIRNVLTFFLCLIMAKYEASVSTIV